MKSLSTIFQWLHSVNLNYVSDRMNQWEVFMWDNEPIREKQNAGFKNINIGITWY